VCACVRSVLLQCPSIRHSYYCTSVSTWPHILSCTVYILWSHFRMFACSCLMSAVVQLFCLCRNLRLYTSAVYEQPFPLHCYFAINTGAAVRRSSNPWKWDSGSVWAFAEGRAMYITTELRNWSIIAVRDRAQNSETELPCCHCSENFILLVFFPCRFKKGNGWSRAKYHAVTRRGVEAPHIFDLR
jgi:hypothetical protein